MKTVFSSHKEVAHVWAQQTQSEGKASRVFFDGPTIFSYGRHFPIARFIDKETVLFTTKGYSVSTSKHISYVRRAIPSGVTVFDVDDVLTNNHAGNLLAMAGRVEELRRKALKARKNGDFFRSEAMANAHQLGEFFKRFPHVKDAAGRKRIKALTGGDLFSPASLAAVKKWEETERKRKAAEQKRLDLEKAEKIEKWKAGEPVEFPYGVNRIFLRVEGGAEVVTSKGARIPLDVARRLWNRIKDSTGHEGGTDHVNGMSLGYYKVDSWDGATLTAGCHKIELVEMQRLAITLNW